MTLIAFGAAAMAQRVKPVASAEVVFVGYFLCFSLVYTVYFYFGMHDLFLVLNKRFVSFFGCFFFITFMLLLFFLESWCLDHFLRVKG